jgi:hypothetical protein
MSFNCVVCGRCDHNSFPVLVRGERVCRDCYEEAALVERDDPDTTFFSGSDGGEEAEGEEEEEDAGDEEDEEDDDDEEPEGDAADEDDDEVVFVNVGDAADEDDDEVVFVNAEVGQAGLEPEPEPTPSGDTAPGPEPDAEPGYVECRSCGEELGLPNPFSFHLAHSGEGWLCCRCQYLIDQMHQFEAEFFVARPDAHLVGDEGEDEEEEVNDVVDLVHDTEQDEHEQLTLVLSDDDQGEESPEKKTRFE